MARLRRFFLISLEEQCLFVRAYCLMITVRMLLVFAPVQSVTKVLDAITKHRAYRPRTNRLTLARAAKRLEQASRLSPVHITCLVQTLVSRALLRQYGYPSKLRIGVLKSGANLEAHAWLEAAGHVHIGDPAPLGKRFIPLAGGERLVE